MKKSEKAKKVASGEEGTVTVSRTIFNQITEEKEFIQVRPFATVPCRIGVKCGRTINLGNFESARVDIHVEMPCYVEEAARVYGEVLALVEEKLSEEVGRISSSLNRGSTQIEELL